MSAKSWKIHRIRVRAGELEQGIPKLRYRDFRNLLREIRIISGEKKGLH